MKKIALQNNSPTSLLENSLLNKGYKYIIGIDEAGRGAWAGPLAMAAFIYTKELDQIANIKDSKLLSPSKREQILKNLRLENSYLELIPAQLIDKVGLAKVIEIAITNLISRINLANAIYLIDGNYKLNVPAEYRSIINGDKNHIVISSASIVAKVKRDRLMLKYDEIFPEYGFKSHKGYGTKQHLNALNKYGICPIHRKSFKPIINI